MISFRSQIGLLLALFCWCGQNTNAFLLPHGAHRQSLRQLSFFVPRSGRLAASVEKEIPAVAKDLADLSAVTQDVPSKFAKNKQNGSQQDEKDENPDKNGKLKVVLVVGFESFNRDLYYEASKDLDINLVIFADSEIRLPQSASEDGSPWRVNPRFAQAVQTCDAFVASLIFDYAGAPFDL